MGGEEKVMGNLNLNQKVPVVRPLSRARIENDTLKFLKQHQPDSLKYAQEVDIEAIFEIVIPQIKPGLKTRYVDLSSIGSGIMGYTDANNKVCCIHQELYEAALADPTSSEGRRFRATVAHEISHCLYHYSYLKTFQSFCSVAGKNTLMRKRSDIPAYKDPEWQAWEQAGALLMPKPCIEKLIEEGKSAWEIADIFNVNPVFVQGRIERLNKLKK